MSKDSSSCSGENISHKMNVGHPSNRSILGSKILGQDSDMSPVPNMSSNVSVYLSITLRAPKLFDSYAIKVNINFIIANRK